MVRLAALCVTLAASLSLAAPSPNHPQVPLALPLPLALPTNFPSSTALPALLASLPLDHARQLQLHLDTYTEPRTLQFSDDPTDRRVLPEGAKALLRLQGTTRFIDVTDDHLLPVQAYLAPLDEPSYPHKITHNASSLDTFFKHISLDHMERFLADFTAHFTRYYRSEHGVKSQQFLQAHLEHLHTTLNPSANLTVTPFIHPSWPQRTLVLRWTSSSVPPSAPAVLITAHQDSTNSLPFLRAPGADDDGSGSVALVAAVAALLSGGWRPRTHPLEVVWFSAEEGGLLGSEEVARRYRAEGRGVRAMYHMDVVGYVAPHTTPSIGLITDGTSAALTAYLARLIPRFSQLPVARTQCGYACSDHGSFDRVGYPAACLSEGEFRNSAPYMHTAQDTMDQPSFKLEHVREFVRIAIGFAVELAGWEGEGTA